MGPIIEYGLIYLKVRGGHQILRNKRATYANWGMSLVLFCPEIIGKQQTWITEMVTRLRHGEITAW